MCSASAACRCAPPFPISGRCCSARLFGLNATQQGVLALVFKVADDNGLLLLDLKDLRAMLQFAGDNASTFTTKYGNISAASIGAIQRSLLEVEQQGGAAFFGEPMLDVDDLLQTDGQGRGMVNVLAAEELIRSPKLYAIFLLWMLSELFERLPEVGDPDKPTLVFFFDEAHLLFTDAPPPLIEKIEQVVRLIRSKGVGVYFVTQSPADVPDTVLGQLGNRVQHALRAFTPRDQKAVKTAADTLRPNPKVDIARAITELAVGEALVSTLDAKGSPTVTERAWIAPPASRIGPITDAECTAVREQTRSLYGHYEQAIDRESAFEKLAGGSGWKGRRGGAGRKGGRGGTGRNHRHGWVLGRLLDHRYAVGHPPRHHRTARRAPRWSRPVGGEERRAIGRLRPRPRHSSGRAWIDPRRID